jgi:transcriptional regulator with XRE-family HTH domain
MHYENYGLSQTEIAAKLDVGVSTVTGWKQRNDMPLMAHLALHNPKVKGLEAELANAKDRIARLEIALVEVLKMK